MTEKVVHYSDHVGSNSEKFYKTTLFRSERLMLGLNCFEPGQVQKVHSHEGQDKFYFVLEGVGHFTVGDDMIEVGPGNTVWAAADVPHGVENRGDERLVVFMGIAPAP